MKNQLQYSRKDRISQNHKYLLIFVWKIHQGLRNGTDPEILRNYLEYSWNTDLRNHLLNEEILISSNLKTPHPVTDMLFQFHETFRNKVKQALNPNCEDISTALENLCILFIEMVRHEERKVKPYLIEQLREEILEEYDKDDHSVHPKFLPEFWKN